jgi:Na+/melibiose symporter-like transporter
MALASAVAASSAWTYMVRVNPGDEAEGFFAVLAALAAGLWVALVFPRMGRSVTRDALYIAAAFPAVGALTGVLLGPVGVVGGAYVAVTLPFYHPMPILPLYAAGVLGAWYLPRA